jgi:hypothetical protein
MNPRPKLAMLVAAVVALMALAMGAAAIAALHARNANTTRVWRESVRAPAQFDLSLAQVRFVAPPRAARSVISPARLASSIRLALRGPTGLDYVAAAVTRFTVSGRPRALVLVVNRRPRGSLAPDLARIDLTLTAAKRLGAPVVSQVSDPLTRVSIVLTAALCRLPTRGTALAAGELRLVLSRGVALNGFTPEAAIAQAYNVVCGRPYNPTFKQAVAQGAGPPCEAAQANIVLCCPPNAMCVPPPCPPCPCGLTPCARTAARIPQAVIACPLQTPPIACPL